MSAGKQMSIGEFAEKEIPDLQTRARFLGVMLGLSLGRSIERTASDFKLAEDDVVWPLIKKYQDIIHIGPAFEFAEMEISDPTTRELFLELAPLLTKVLDISVISERKDLDNNHPVWPFLQKYIKELQR